jgi:nucleotide-binding universal stress UspA family protein
MFDTVVVATDGSKSVERAVTVTLDFAERFEADVHALYVLDDRDAAEAADAERRVSEADARTALADVEAATDRPVTTAVREGDPAAEIMEYAEAHDADLVAMGTRGRHGEYRFLIGSVAEEVVRTCPVPVLTVRQLAEGDDEVLGGRPERIHRSSG